MKKIIFALLVLVVPVLVFAQNNAPENGTENNVKIRHVYCGEGGACYVAFRRPLGVVCGGYDWMLNESMLAMVLANPDGRYNATCANAGNGSSITALWLVP